jgi:hypothetical protein
VDLVEWIPTVISAATLVSVIAGRKWIEANIEKRVQHQFDTKLESTRSQLRAREAQISALRDMVLNGTAQRQGLLDKRRIDAVERIWAATNRLAPFAAVSASMASINFDAASKRTPHEEKLRQFFNMIAPTTLVENIKKDQTIPAINERPFISPLAWAYFSAYQSIVMGAYTTARVLAEGVEDAGKLLKRDHGRELLKATLPHQTEFIDSNDPSAYHELLTEIHELLLIELRKILDGREVDRTAIDKAKEITSIISKIELERAEQTAALAAR